MEISKLLKFKIKYLNIPPITWKVKTAVSLMVPNNLGNC